MKICEVFEAHQGEVNVGRLSLFIRTSGCTLNCGFCDSKYHNKDAIDLSVKELFEECIKHNRIVITGGEPLLQQDEVAKLIDKIQNTNPHIIIEIETNGTIVPLKINNIIYNVSPKLENSGNILEKRINKDALIFHVKHGSNFKFVVETIEDVDEVNNMVEDYNIPKYRVFLMPKGATRQEQLDNMEGVIKMAKLYGYNFSPRVHVLIFDRLRGV